MPTGVYKRVKPVWNKGRKMPLEERAKLSKTLKLRGIKPKERWVRTGEENRAWKGDKASYSAIHYWIERQLGKPKECVECGTKTSKKYEWANISGQYMRDINDFKRLCCKCHKKFDNVNQRGWITRNQRI